MRAASERPAELRGGRRADEQPRVAGRRLQGLVEQPFGLAWASGVDGVPGALHHGLEALWLAGRRAWAERTANITAVARMCTG